MKNANGSFMKDHKSINLSEEVLKESQCYYNCNLKRHKINLVQ